MLRSSLETLLGNFRVSIRAGGVQRGPGIRVLQVYGCSCMGDGDRRSVQIKGETLMLGMGQEGK